VILPILSATGIISGSFWIGFMNKKNENQVARGSKLMRTEFVRIVDVQIDIILVDILKLL
jgi:hypothetical protein